MSNFFTNIPSNTSDPGILTINADPTPDQVIVGAGNISVGSTGGTTTISGSGLLPLSGGTMTGDLNMGSHDIIGAARVAQGFSAHTVTNGEDYTISNGWAYITFNSASAVATQTTNFPLNPIDGQIQTISCVGGGIDAWTITTPVGSFFTPVPTTLRPMETYQWLFTSLGGGFWVQLFTASLPVIGGDMVGDINFVNATQNLITADSTNTQIIFTPTVNPTDLAIQFWTGAGANINSLNILRNGTVQIGAGTGAPIQSFGSLNFDHSGAYNINLGNFSDQINWNASGTPDSPDCFLSSTNTGALHAEYTGSNAIALEVASTNNCAGVLFPLMTTTQKNAIVSPPEGLMVYDTTLHAICVFNGTAWKTVTAV